MKVQCETCLQFIEAGDIPEDLKFRPKFCSIGCARASGMDLNSKGIPYCVYIDTLKDQIE